MADAGGFIITGCGVGATGVGATGVGATGVGVDGTDDGVGCTGCGLGGCGLGGCIGAADNGHMCAEKLSCRGDDEVIPTTGEF